MRNRIFIIGALIVFFSCEKTLTRPLDDDEVLDGPVSNLNSQELRRFLDGDEAFNEVFTIDKGLGPIFVSNQCSSCHPGDGKGSPFVEFIRFGQIDSSGNKFVHLGGPQLQHKAIPGFRPENLPPGATYTTLIAPAVTGLGFLDAVSDEDLIALSDPHDIDMDGISGRPHWNEVPPYVEFRPNYKTENGNFISRFGKKAAAYDLLHQTAGAYNQDMGITSIYESIDPFSRLEIDPEISTQTIHDLVFYLKTLKAPIQRDQDKTDVKKGKVLFGKIGCSKCHVPKLRTSYSPISAISNKEFYPYTDLLLHDMGSELDDGYTEGYAKTSEWRTPPLWGLGLSKESQGGNYFLLHDGRAKSIESAILFHGGEATPVKNEYLNLSPSEKSQLLIFLESL